MKRSRDSNVDAEPLTKKGKLEKHVRFCEVVTVGKAITMSRENVNNSEQLMNCPNVSVDVNLTSSPKVCSFKLPVNMLCVILEL